MIAKMSGYGYNSRPYSPPDRSYSRPNGGASRPSGPSYPSNDYNRAPDPYRPYSPPGESSYRREAPYNPPSSSAYDYPPYPSSHAYPQPYETQDQYDPYHPTPTPSESTASAYRPYSPPPPRRSPVRPPRQPPVREAPRGPPPKEPWEAPRTFHTQPPAERTVASASGASPEETYLLTPPTWSIIAGAMTYIHQLPSSHLPLVKYVATSKAEAVALHKRLLAQANASIWYTDGSLRGGECWSAAIEWKTELSTSGKKMRECVGEGDALDAELGGMRKAVQAFIEDLPNRYDEPPELIIFSDSQAAIVSLDTSTRPESRKFCELYESILQRFPSTRITLVWIPGHYGIEGNELADKIAVVGATNSYLKRKKQGSLNYIYRAGPDSETLPGASSQPGVWQKGSADPRAPEFKPAPVPPPPPPQILSQSSPASVPPAMRDPYAERPPFPPTLPVDLPTTQPFANEQIVKSEPLVKSEHVAAARQRTPELETKADSTPVPNTEAEEDGLEAKEGSLFVTNFPEDATAKDIGILFGQFGSIIAVDIFSIPPIQPRFALVSYNQPIPAGPNAIAALDRKAISFETDWARDHAADLTVWKGWEGSMVVVPSEGGTLVPQVVAVMFPDLPDWAIGRGPESQKRSRGASEVSESSPRKRQRTASEGSDMHVDVESPAASETPQVKVEVQEAPEPSVLPEVVVAHNAAPAEPAPPPAVQPAPSVEAEVSPSKKPLGLPPFPPTLSTTMPPFPPKALPPFPPSLTVPAPTQAATLPPTPSSAAATTHTHPVSSTTISSASITDLATAQPVLTELKIVASIRREEIVRIQQLQTRFAPSNWIGQLNYLTEQFSVARAELGESILAAEDGRKDIKSYEATLAERGFTKERIEAFVRKVLAVLDGIAKEDADAQGLSTTVTSQTDLPTALQLIDSLQHTCASLQAQLDGLTSSLSEKTRQMIAPLEALYAGVNEALLEAGKDRDEVQRRSLVLEGMLSKGEVVGAVVGFLLSK